MNSENIFDQHLSIWRLLLLNSSSSWDFCWMQSTQNENDSAGILSLSLSLFWCFLCDSLSLFDMNMFPFTFWARFSETVSLSILNQKNFYSCFLSVLLSQSSSQYALFLFLVHISLLCPNLTNTTLFAPKLLFDLPPPRRCRPSSLQKQTRAPCNGFMIQPWPVPLFHMCTSGNIWGILIQMLYKGVSFNCCHTGFVKSINVFVCLFARRSANNVEQFPICLWMLPVQLAHYDKQCSKWCIVMCEWPMYNFLIWCEVEWRLFGF